MNRLVAIVVALVALAVLIAALAAGDLLAAVAAAGVIAYIAGKWLDGWHGYEKAVYASNLQAQHAAREQAAQEELLARQAERGKGNNVSSLKLPR